MPPSVLPVPVAAAFPPQAQAQGFCVVMADATAPAHVHGHYPSWPAAVHAVQTAYPFGHVVPAAWLAETRAA